MTLTEQFREMKNGKSAAEVLNDGQSLARLEWMFRNHTANQAKPKRCKRPATRRRPSTRKVPADASLRGSYHQQEDARLRAEAVKVDRVNKLEKKPASVFVNGMLTMVIGG